MILDMGTVDRIQADVQVVAVSDRIMQEYGPADYLAAVRVRAAKAIRHRVGVADLDERDFVLERKGQDASHLMTSYEVRWAPAAEKPVVEMCGGPANGKLFVVESLDRPLRVDTLSVLQETLGPVAPTSQHTYRLAGWNTDTRHWVYREEF